MKKARLQQQKKGEKMTEGKKEKQQLEAIEKQTEELGKERETKQEEVKRKEVMVKELKEGKNRERQECWARSKDKMQRKKKKQRRTRRKHQREFPNTHHIPDLSCHISEQREWQSKGYHRSP